MNEWLEQSKFEGVKAKILKLKANGTEIPKLVAYVHDLWQDYILSDEQEAELFEAADPEEKYNDVYDYWDNMTEENPLMELLK